MAPVHGECINATYLFRAKSGAAGVTDAVPAAGGPALQPQRRSRAALPQHGGESWAAHTRQRMKTDSWGFFLKHIMFFLVCLIFQVWVQEHPYRQVLRGDSALKS